MPEPNATKNQDNQSQINTLQQKTQTNKKTRNTNIPRAKASRTNVIMPPKETSTPLPRSKSRPRNKSANLPNHTEYNGTTHFIGPEPNARQRNGWRQKLRRGARLAVRFFPRLVNKIDECYLLSDIPTAKPNEFHTFATTIIVQDSRYPFNALTNSQIHGAEREEIIASLSEHFARYIERLRLDPDSGPSKPTVLRVTDD